MIFPHTSKFLAIGSAMVLASGSGNAANTIYDPGNLLLFFQKPGGSDTVYVDLGSAANFYRGTAAGTVGDEGLSRTNIVNISSTLTSAFGPGWASDPDLYAGIVGARSASAGIQVFDGDHTRTVYASRARESVATVGAPNSVPWDFTLTGASTNAATNIIAMGNTFEVNGTQGAEIIDVGISTIDDQNPFVNVPLGVQDTAFNAFAGGVQQRGSASAFGNVNGVGTVEFALDLYRITARPDSETTDQEVAGVSRVGSFEGSFFLGNDGGVSFLVPEPSSITLLGMAGLGLAFRRRRNA